MSQKKTKLNCHALNTFLKLKMRKKSSSAWACPADPDGGAYDATPDPLVGWGEKCPLPFPVPLDVFGASILGAVLQIKHWPHSSLVAAQIC